MTITTVKSNCFPIATRKQSAATTLFFSLLLTAKSKRAGTGKSKLTPVPTPVDKNTSKGEVSSDAEAGEDSDYDTDLEFEEPRPEYDPTGKINSISDFLIS